jgi:hypothetical protein
VLKSDLVMSRSRILPISIALLVGAGLSVGCRKSGPSEDAMRKSIAALKPQFDELKKRFMDLHQRVDAIPANLEGFGEARARFFAAEEARGVTDYKVTWLSERLDAALKAGNREELQELAKDIAGTQDDIRRIDEVHTKLLHEIMSFERQARQVKEAAAVPPPAAAPTPTPASPKTKRPKAN